MGRIDDFDALLPPVLVEASFGCDRDRAVLHERRAMYPSPDRAPPTNFRPFGGRTRTAASRARRLDRFEGNDPVEPTSIGLTLPAEAFFLDLKDGERPRAGHPAARVLLHTGNRPSFRKPLALERSNEYSSVYSFE